MTLQLQYESRLEAACQQARTSARGEGSKRGYGEYHLKEVVRPADTHSLKRVSDDTYIWNN